MFKQQIKYLGISIAILCTIYFTVSMTINFEEIYIKFHTKVSDIGYDAKASSIVVSHFPLPKVMLKDVNVPGFFDAQTISIYFSIFSILTFNPSIDFVEIDKSHISYQGVNVEHHEEAIVKLFKTLYTVPNVDINNVTLIDTTSGNMINIPSILIRPNSSKNIAINWTDRSRTNISYNKKQNLEVQIETSSPYHTINITELYNPTLKLESGTINYRIKNLKEYIDNSYQDLDLLVTQIASIEPANISCDFTSDPTGLLFKNINFVSNSITMVGDAYISSGTQQNIVNLHFNKINLTKLLKAPDMDSITLSKQKSELKLNNLNSIFNINADQVLLHGLSINNLKIIAASDGQKLNISEFSGGIQEDGTFSIAGAVTQNQYRSKFNGKINLIHPNLNNLLRYIGYNDSTSYSPSPLSIIADIEATPIDYKLTNLSTKIGSTSANGSASIKLIGTTPRINLALRFSSLDFASIKHPIITPMTDYFKSLTINMSDPEYSNKYIPLRKIGYLGNFDITLINPIVNGQNIDKIHVICYTSSGILDFTSLYYLNGKDYLVGTGKLLSTGLKPIVRLYINDGEWSTNSLSFANMLDNLNRINKNYALDKVTLDLAVALRNLNQDNQSIKNFYIAAINDDKLFNISALQGYYNTGGFVSSGNILLDSMTLNLSYAYSNFNINDLNIFYPIEIFGIKDGWVSSNGTISTTGDNLTKWVYNLYTKSAFVASTIKWSGFDIDELVNATDNPSYNSANITTDAEHFLSQDSTDFNKISGKYEILHGIINFSDIKFSTKRISGTASASYNIYKSEVDSTTKATFAPISRNVYNTPDSVEFSIRTYGNIISPKKELDLSNIKHMLERNKRNLGGPYNKPILE